MSFQIFVNEIKSKRNTMMNTPHAIELHVLCKISILFFFCAKLQVYCIHVLYT